MNLEAIRDLLLRRGKELFDEPQHLRHFTKNLKADLLLKDLEHYPHAFVLACIMDRQMKAERAWLIPYLFSQKIGDFDFGSLRSLSLAEIRDFMTKPVPLHRYPERMSENFYEAVLS
jgi:endonuclease III